jgi:ketosteroid isomerase-like protein
MSPANVEVVRGSFEAFRAGDYDRALEAFDPAVVYDLTHFPEGRVYHGREGVVEAFRNWMSAFEDYRQELDELVDAGGDHVIAVVHEFGRGRGSGVETQRSTAGLWTLRDARAIRIRFYDSKEEALQAIESENEPPQGGR